MQEATEAKGGLDLQGAASLLMAMMQASADTDGHNALMEQLASAMGYKLVRETPQPRQRSRSKKARAARYAQPKLSLVKPMVWQNQRRQSRFAAARTLTP